MTEKERDERLDYLDGHDRRGTIVTIGGIVGFGAAVAGALLPGGFLLAIPALGVAKLAARARNNAERKRLMNSSGGNKKMIPFGGYGGVPMYSLEPENPLTALARKNPRLAYEAMHNESVVRALADGLAKVRKGELRKVKVNIDGRKPWVKIRR